MNIFKGLFKPKDNIISLKSMQRLEIRDGDIIVLKHPNILRPSTKQVIMESLKRVIEKAGFNNVQVILLQDNMEIGIIGKNNK